MTMDIVHLPACEVRKRYTVDWCFVIVDQATGYVIAVPATLKGLDARKLADCFWRNVCFSLAFPVKS